MGHSVIIAGVLAVSAAPALPFPPGAPRLPAVIDVRAAEAASACRHWLSPNTRPVPSAERVTLRADPAVARAGARLAIGRQTFTDEVGDEEIDRLQHRYVGRLAGLNARLVYQRPYEGHVWLLVSDDAAPIPLPGVPLASPRGHAIAAAADDPVFRQSGVTIVEHRMQGLAVGETFPDIAWPCDMRWVSDGELSLSVSTDPSRGPGAWARATIRREAGRWVYHPPGTAP
jgi:hypothetical protein